MSPHTWKSLFILMMLCTTVACNGILLFTRIEQKTNIKHLKKDLAQKENLIHLTKNKPRANSAVSHRLALPSNRLDASEEFQTLSTSLHLQRLDFQISPEQDVNAPLAKDFLSESSVELKFTNQSDTPLYEMINRIMNDFPGLVKPTEIVLWRDFDSKTPLIHGHFRFEWLKAKNEDIT